MQKLTHSDEMNDFNYNDFILANKQQNLSDFLQHFIIIDKFDK